MAFLNIFKSEGRMEAAEGSPAQRVTTFDIFAGGSGGEAGALKLMMEPGAALYYKSLGKPHLYNPETYMVDMDSEARGLEKAAIAENRLNTLAACDQNGTAFGYYRITNASISAKMEGSKGENTTLNDMIEPDDEASRMLMDAVLTAEEAALERKVGGQGKGKLVEMWSSIYMKVDSMQELVSNITKAYIDGRRVLVRITGSATGATGATFLRTLPRTIHESCRAANPALIDNLRIHTIVITGYAIHPGENDSSAFALDCTEDDFKVLNWTNERNESGVDKIIDMTYYVFAKPAMCYERFARGGNQGRHYSLGDFMCMMAVRDSSMTAFNESGDGYKVFKPTPGDDQRFGWGDMANGEARRQYINYLRFCAAVWLKLRPLTTDSHEGVKVAPHVVKMLGKDAPADKLEQEVIRPLQAMIGIAGDALEAFGDIGASGTDFSREPVTYMAEDTTIFNPYAIRAILTGGVEDEEVNDFDLDLLTQYDKGSGTANEVQTRATVGSAYNKATEKIRRGASAAEFLLELYRALAI